MPVDVSKAIPTGNPGADVRPALLRWWVLGAFLFGTLLFSWPALVNGGPFFFPDTSAYLRGADAAIVEMNGHRSEWSDRLVAAAPTEGAEVGDQADAGEEKSAGMAERSDLRPTRPVLLNRSVYFGAVLYTAMALAGGIGAVLLIAGFTTLSVIAIVLATPLGSRRRRLRLLLPTLAAIGLFTPLPFFISRLMPDSFSGLLVAGLASLILFWPHLNRWSRALLILMATAAVTFHATHVMVAVVTGVLSLLVSDRRRTTIIRGIALCGGLFLVAAGAHLAFVIAVESKLGTTPIAPPFLSARLIDDGPGYRELRRSCPTERWALCPYLARMPQPSDTFLWSNDPQIGVFMAVPPDAQRAIGEQDRRFAVAVLASQPAAVMRSALGSTWRQVTAYELEHFNYHPSELAGYAATLPAAIYERLASTAAARGTMPVTPTLVLLALALLGSSVMLGWSVLRWFRGQLSPADKQLLGFALVVTGAVLANSIICGALSTPHGRYQMRLIWLIPFAAALLFASMPRMRAAKWLQD